VQAPASAQRRVAVGHRIAEHPAQQLRRLAMTAGRKLHVGGKQAAPGWEILNAVPAPEVDHVGDARDLSCFPDATFVQIYASHVVEHFDYKFELARALREWHRVLVPGGRVLISVPDMDVLSRLFVERASLSMEERFLLMRMMFGGHVDAYDHHQVGLNDEFLAWFLGATGFRGMRRVERLGLFNDTSETRFRGLPISLNMIAHKPVAGAPAMGDDGIPGPDELDCICGSQQLFVACHGRPEAPAVSRIAPG
jgi:predicted SAM-dependent methyltransferase